MPDEYRMRLSRMSATDYVTELAACGWFTALSSEQHAPLIHRVHTAFETDPLATFRALAHFDFDSEYIYDSGPHPGSYYSLLLLFAHHSHGFFAPTNIRDDTTSDGNAIHVSFWHDGRFYECMVANTDYVQPEVWSLIDRALTDSNAPYRFFSLPAIDQAHFVVFVAPTLYQCAEQRGLIPPWDYF